MCRSHSELSLEFRYHPFVRSQDGDLRGAGGLADTMLFVEWPREYTIERRGRNEQGELLPKKQTESIGQWDTIDHAEVVHPKRHDCG